MEEHVRRGDKVFCRTNREMGQSREDKIMDGVSYSTVTPRLCYRLSARICALPEGSGRRKLLSAVHFVLNKAKLLLSYPTWPLISPAYAARIYRRGLKICKAHGIDAVIPIYTQIDTLIAAKWGDNSKYHGYIGVIGPNRMSYEQIMPVTQYTAKRLTEIMTEAQKDMED